MISNILRITSKSSCISDTDLMTEDELHAKLQKGYDDIEAGRVQNAEKVFAEFREKHWNFRKL